MKTLIASITLTFTLTLAACQLQPTPPQTPRQTLAYTEALFTAAVEQLAFECNIANTIPQTTCDNARSIIIDADAALDAAHASILAGDDQSNLSSVNDAIRVLRLALQEKEID